MKTISDLFNLVSKAVESNIESNSLFSKDTGTVWFIDYSGHVNKLSIRYFRYGWKAGGEAHSEDIQEVLTEDGIQSMYWFIKSRLNN
tara:strand:+ start:255 stop:515 length:261 start_codon:yes stop_codon:yes gene_type:complete